LAVGIELGVALALTYPRVWRAEPNGSSPASIKERLQAGKDSQVVQTTRDVHIEGGIGQPRVSRRWQRLTASDNSTVVRAQTVAISSGVTYSEVRDMSKDVVKRQAALRFRAVRLRVSVAHRCPQSGHCRCTTIPWLLNRYCQCVSQLRVLAQSPQFRP
jgi:hypothetical protein